MDAPDETAREPSPATAAARRIGLTLPDACIAGVAANLRLLDSHRAIVRGAAPDD